MLGAALLLEGLELDPCRESLAKILRVRCDVHDEHAGGRKRGARRRGRETRGVDLTGQRDEHRGPHAEPVEQVEQADELLGLHQQWQAVLDQWGAVRRQGDPQSGPRVLVRHREQVRGKRRDRTRGHAVQGPHRGLGLGLAERLVPGRVLAAGESARCQQRDPHGRQPGRRGTSRHALLAPCHSRKVSKSIVPSLNTWTTRTVESSLAAAVTTTYWPSCNRPDMS